MIVLATRNRHKVEEIRAITGRSFACLLDFPEIPEVIEDLPDLEGNALKKACEVARALAVPAVADDTGLFVDALLGEPGVYSARYAGPSASYAANNRKLLERLRGRSERTARFRCVAAFATAAGEHFLCEGVLAGRILEAPRGEGGFGYDPLFFVPELGRTLAELSAEEKNRISHRGKAFVRLVEELERRGL